MTKNGTPQKDYKYAYSYDSDGNRLSETRNSFSLTYQNNNLDQRMILSQSHGGTKKNEKDTFLCGIMEPDSSGRTFVALCLRERNCLLDRHEWGICGRIYQKQKYSLTEPRRHWMKTENEIETVVVDCAVRQWTPKTEIISHKDIHALAGLADASKGTG